jgi:hypothetical protein
LNQLLDTLEEPAWDSKDESGTCVRKVTTPLEQVAGAVAGAIELHHTEASAYTYRKFSMLRAWAELRDLFDLTLEDPEQFSSHQRGHFGQSKDCKSTTHTVKQGQDCMRHL